MVQSYWQSLAVLAIYQQDPTKSVLAAKGAQTAHTIIPCASRKARVALCSLMFYRVSASPSKPEDRGWGRKGRGGELIRAEKGANSVVAVAIKSKLHSHT